MALNETTHPECTKAAAVYLVITVPSCQQSGVMFLFLSVFEVHTITEKTTCINSFIEYCSHDIAVGHMNTK